MKRTFLSLALFALISSLCNVAGAQEADRREVGKSYFDKNRYIEYIPGDMPLILVSVGDGSVQPAHITDRGRTNPNCPPGKRISTVREIRTNQLAKLMQEHFFNAYGVRPYVLMAQINRKKLDLDRDIDVAACKNPEMEQLWTEWHSWMHQAISETSKKFGHTLFVDLHSHGHTKPAIELGYLLPPHLLAGLANNFYSESSAAANRSSESPSLQGQLNPHSLFNLMRLKGKKGSLKDTVLGDASIGNFLEQYGLMAIPSKQTPFPNPEDDFTWSGYITQLYSSKKYPDSSGVRIALHGDARQSANIRTTAQIVANGVGEFMRNHGEFKGWKLPASKVRPPMAPPPQPKTSPSSGTATTAPLSSSPTAVSP